MDCYVYTHGCTRYGCWLPSRFTRITVTAHAHTVAVCVPFAGYFIWLVTHVTVVLGCRCLRLHTHARLPTFALLRLPHAPHTRLRLLYMHLCYGFWLGCYVGLPTRLPRYGYGCWLLVTVVGCRYRLRLVRLLRSTRLPRCADTFPVGFTLRLITVTRCYRTVGYAFGCCCRLLFALRGYVHAVTHARYIAFTHTPLPVYYGCHYTLRTRFCCLHVYVYIVAAVTGYTLLVDWLHFARCRRLHVTTRYVPVICRLLIGLRLVVVPFTLLLLRTHVLTLLRIYVVDCYVTFTLPFVIRLHLLVVGSFTFTDYVHTLLHLRYGYGLVTLVAVPTVCYTRFTHGCDAALLLLPHGRLLLPTRLPDRYFTLPLVCRSLRLLDSRVYTFTFTLPAFTFPYTPLPAPVGCRLITYLPLLPFGLRYADLRIPDHARLLVDYVATTPHVAVTYTICAGCTGSLRAHYAVPGSSRAGFTLLVPVTRTPLHCPFGYCGYARRLLLTHRYAGCCYRIYAFTALRWVVAGWLHTFTFPTAHTALYAHYGSFGCCLPFTAPVTATQLFTFPRYRYTRTLRGCPGYLLYMVVGLHTAWFVRCSCYTHCATTYTRLRVLVPHTARVCYCGYTGLVAATRRGLLQLPRTRAHTFTAVTTVTRLRLWFCSSAVCYLHADYGLVLRSRLLPHGLVLHFTFCCVYGWVTRGRYYRVAVTLRCRYLHTALPVAADHCARTVPGYGLITFPLFARLGSFTVVRIWFNGCYGCSRTITLYVHTTFTTHTFTHTRYTRWVTHHVRLRLRSRLPGLLHVHTLRTAPVRYTLFHYRFPCTVGWFVVVFPVCTRYRVHIPGLTTPHYYVRYRLPCGLRLCGCTHVYYRGLHLRLHSTRVCFHGCHGSYTRGLLPFTVRLRITLHTLVRLIWYVA